jgi:chromosome segregation ATPase
MHHCHRASREEHIQWMKTITEWRRSHRDTLALLTEIESSVRSHDAAVESFADEIRLHEMEIALHEMEIADHEHGGKDKDHESLAKGHEVTDKGHERRRAGLKTLEEAQAQTMTRIRELAAKLTKLS